MTDSPLLSPAIRILLVVAAALVALWGMSQYAAYINSAMLAALIVLASGTLVDWLRARRLPN
jgi:predicted PurR-regulated permease PerM